MVLEQRQVRALSDFPLFLKAIKAYRNRYSYFLKLLNHPDLSRPEKRLLEVKYLLKKKKFQKAHEVLRSLSGLPEVLEAYRKLLLAYVRDGLGQPLDLVEQTGLCNALRTLQDDSGYFTASIDLALELSIQGEQGKALETILAVEGLRHSDWQKANWLRSSVLIYARQGDRPRFLESASALREMLEPLKPFHAHLCLTAIAYGLTLIGDLQGALELYRELLAKFRTTDVFIDRFWFLLLDTLVNGVSLPATPVALREREIFFLRYNIIRSLQCGELENAVQDWSRLRETRPSHYGESLSMRLEYLERTAFGRCIVLFLKDKPANSSKVSLEKLSPRVATLVKLLLGAPTPLRRPQLIEMIYHEPYSPKFDKRFYQLVIEAKKAGVPIRNRSGAYLVAV